MNHLKWPGIVSIAAMLLATASSQTLAQRVGMGRTVVRVNGAGGYQIGGSIGMGPQALTYGAGYQAGGCVGMGQVQINGAGGVGYQTPYAGIMYGQQPAVLNGLQSGTTGYVNPQPSASPSYSTDPDDRRDSFNTLMSDLTSTVSNRELTVSQANQISQDVSYALRVGTTNRTAVARLQSDIKALPKYTKLTPTTLKTITEDIHTIVPATRPKEKTGVVAKGP
jgi:hypothetical protein